MMVHGLARAAGSKSADAREERTRARASDPDGEPRAHETMSQNRPQTPGEALARTVAALMRRGEAFPDTVMKDPTGDTRRRGDVHGRGESGLAGSPGRPGNLNFTGRNIDRFFLVGCSPYTFLQGTKSELLPPLTRDGYRLELPIKWLVDNKKKIDDGLKVVKLLTAAGRVSGLPLPQSRCLPSELVSKAEAQAVAALDVILEQAESIEDAPVAASSASAKSTGRGASSTTKAATGKAYKALRKLLSEQCHDQELMHCELKKARAADGTIEFVSAESRERFMREGGQCLIWNQLAASAAEDATALEAAKSEDAIHHRVDADETAGAATVVEMVNDAILNAEVHNS